MSDQAAAPDAPPSRDEVMARRFYLDAEITAIAQRHKTELAPLAEELTMCEQFIKKTMIDGNEQQVKMADGSMCFFVSKDSVAVKDMDAVVGYILAAAPPPSDFPTTQWQAILQHIQATGLWTMLNKAVNKTNVKEIIETTKVTPPGLEYSSFRDLNWRRGKAPA